MRCILFLILLLLRPAAMAVVQEISQASQLEVNVTFYPQEMALIREKRTAFLKLGSNKLLIKDVPSSVLMDSFLFQPVPPSPSIKILEYNFQGPDITRETLLKHSIGQAVNILSQTTSQIPSNGKLLSVDGENAILDAQGTIFSVPKNQIIFPHLPYTLVAEPMITLKLMNAKEGDYQFDLGYLAKGFSWDAGYTIIVATDGSALDLNSWLTIHNTSRFL